MASEQELRQTRLNKITKLKEKGIIPYPEKFSRTHTLTQIPSLKENTTTSCAGRLILLRKMGRLAFGFLQDQSGKAQIVFNADELGENFKLLRLIDLGDFLGINGTRFTTKKGEPSILAKSITFLGKALRPLPEKFHGLADEETRHRQRYLELISDPQTMQRFLFRSNFIRALREFYWQEGFHEVETPTLLHSATGASARPYITHNNALDIDVFLRISHEIPLKEIIIGGFEKIFEIGKAFRNEGADPSHLPEHTHLEHYCAYWNFEDNITFTERLFDYLFSKLNLNKKRTLLDKEGQEREVDFTTPWKRLNFTELINEKTGLDLLSYQDAKLLRQDLKSKNIHFEAMETMGLATLTDNLYKKLIRPQLTNPVILYSYPKYLQPLARVNDKDPRLVDQFQVIVNGWEIVKAYSELVDPVDQAERFAEQARDAAAGDEEAQAGDDDFITALEHGAPPISGWGMGLDRTIALLTNQSNLREIIFFPLLRPTPTSPKTTPQATTCDPQIFKNKPPLTLPKAREILKKHIKEEHLLHHSLETEAIMRTLAKHFKADEETWALAALIHDLDWPLTEKSITEHGPRTCEIIASEGYSLSPEIMQAVLAHNEKHTGIKRESQLDYALAAAENITGLIIAYALVRPSKNLEGAETKSLTKKFKDKSFAANVSREMINDIETIGLSRKEFFLLALTAMQKIAPQIGL